MFKVCTIILITSQGCLYHGPVVKFEYLYEHLKFNGYGTILVNLRSEYYTLCLIVYVTRSRGMSPMSGMLFLKYWQKQCSNSFVFSIAKFFITLELDQLYWGLH